MGNFACTCGHVISDVQYPNENTGWLLSSRRGESFFNSIGETVDGYLRHAADDDIDGWRHKHFDNSYPDDIPVGEMLHDALTTRFFDSSLATMECDECGRLWVQREPGANNYRAYSADDDTNSRTNSLGFYEVVNESTKNQDNGT